MTTPSDNRSPLAKAYQWSSRIMIVSLEMVLPAFAGWWIDQRLKTQIVFLLIGLSVGCTVGAWHLMRLVNSGRRKGDHNSDR